METVSGKVVLLGSVASACGRVPLVGTVSHSGSDNGLVTAHCDAQVFYDVSQNGGVRASCVDLRASCVDPCARIFSLSMRVAHAAPTV